MIKEELLKFLSIKRLSTLWSLKVEKILKVKYPLKENKSKETFLTDPNSLLHFCITWLTWISHFSVIFIQSHISCDSISEYKCCAIFTCGALLPSLTWLEIELGTKRRVKIMGPELLLKASGSKKFYLEVQLNSEEGCLKVNGKWTLVRGFSIKRRQRPFHSKYRLSYAASVIFCNMVSWD